MLQKPVFASDRKRRVWENSEREASRRRSWRRKAAFFHSEDLAYLRFLIPPGSRVLEVGCGTGDTLAALKPSVGVGIDFSPTMIAEARAAYPEMTFIEADVEDPRTLQSAGGPFDFILLVDTLGGIEDCQKLLEGLHQLCGRETRIVIAYYSHLWHPVLKLGERLGVRMPQPPQNVLSSADIEALAELSDHDAVKREQRILCPVRLLGLGRIVNRFVSPLPILRSLALRSYVVCRSRPVAHDPPKSATVVVPARNERENIEATVLRMPAFCEDLELIFIEGHSKDGTYEEMERVKAAYPQLDIKLMRQPGKGKADAVFTAFDVARGDVLMILDADLTMPPEQLPKFWAAIQSGKGEFVNGSRLVYPMEDQAMRFLNLVANKAFASIFSWLLNQRVTDTLCGTKVLRRSDYERLKRGRDYFGNFDPFGDFDLIFGGSKLNLKMVEVPIRYANRVYGETQISRFRHGLLLARMVGFAFTRMKAL